ncbi:MAG: hypothetical protein JW910_02585 [Anaerolineae bacterium]|nr:hypothetical protein [Anaerolineae bacterium]
MTGKHESRTCNRMTQGLSTPRPLILKLDTGPRQFDTVYDALVAAGFHVVRSSTPAGALLVARRCYPNLFVCSDQPSAGLDAERWIERQHADRVAGLALAPLIVLAGPLRVEVLRAQEIPDRVVVMARPPDLATLVSLARRLVDLWAGA